MKTDPLIETQTHKHTHVRKTFSEADSDFAGKQSNVVELQSERHWSNLVKVDSNENVKASQCREFKVCVCVCVCACAYVYKDVCVSLMHVGGEKQMTAGRRSGVDTAFWSTSREPCRNLHDSAF